MTDRDSIPTLYEWAGGQPALERLTTHFYTAVKADDLLGPVFAGMHGGHPQYVAAFIGEVFGGPNVYSESRGGHPHMVAQHLDRRLTEPQRRRWIELLLDSADAVGIPDDPEFRSALVAYLEWGSRLAVLNSQPGAQAVTDAPVPKWGWGVPGGPYQG
jgi:hemoglobin